MDLSSRISIAMALIGLAAGFIMYRSDFCLAGMVRDHVLYGEKRLIRPLLVIVLLSAPLFELLRGFGFAASPLFDLPSLNHLAGGLIFGIGMVLSGACVSGTFWKLGSGQGLQLATILGLFTGSALFAEVAPFSTALDKYTHFASVTIPELLGVSPFYVIAPLLAIGAGMLKRWTKRGLWKHKYSARGYIEPWKAGAAIAVLGAASIAITGIPLSVTTIFAKTVAAVESAVAPGHFAKVDFFKTSAEMVLPLQKGVLNWGSGPLWDSAADIQIPFLVFMTLGGFIGAKSAGDFEWHFRVPASQYLSALLGGILMGLGSRAAGGCNVWHLLGGLPFFSISSLIFFLALYPGAFLGVKLLEGKVLTTRRTS